MKTRTLISVALLIVLVACGPAQPPITRFADTPSPSIEKPSPTMRETHVYETAQVQTQDTIMLLPTATPHEATRTPLPPTNTPRRTTIPISTPCPTLQGMGERNPETFVPIGVIMESQSYGDYLVRLYGGANSYRGSAIEVLRNEERIFVYKGLSWLAIGEFWVEGTETDEGFVIPIGEDITGDGLPNLVIFEWTGGTYCCAMNHIYELGDEFRYIDTTGSGDYPLEVADLDHDGSLEFTIHDSCFRSFRGRPRASGSYGDPRVILRYADGSYQIAVELMRKPAPSIEELLALVQQNQREIEWENFREDAFWKILLDLIYSGHADLVEPFLETVWPDDPATREEYVEMLRLGLPECWSWPEILELNPEWPWLEE